MDNNKLNKFVRSCIDHPEDWGDVEWKVYKSAPGGEYWYIPLEDAVPGDDNIIEGHTGTLMYLDREDAYAQWGVEKEYEDSNYYASYRNLRQILDELPDDFELSDGADTWTVYGLTEAIRESYYRLWMEEAEDHPPRRPAEAATGKPPRTPEPPRPPRLRRGRRQPLIFPQQFRGQSAPGFFLFFALFFCLDI